MQSDMAPIISSIVSVIVALTTLIAGVVTLRKLRAEEQTKRAEGESVEAQAEELRTRTILTLLEPMRQEIERLRAELIAERARREAEIALERAKRERLECEMVALRHDYEQVVQGAYLLLRQVENAGLHPVWKPQRPPESSQQS